MSDISEAFEEALEGAIKPVEQWFCTLYYRESWYGGAEEGGWWGSTTTAEYYVAFNLRDEAEAALDAVKNLAIEKTKEAKRMHGEVCLQQLDYCERRGIDDPNSIFGEVQGEDSYYVMVENKLGSCESSDSRHYE